MSDPIVVLIVDDSLDDRLLYRRYLERAEDSSYLIVEVDSGDKVLKYINETSPQCVLLDYSLPGRDGVEVLKEIRSAFPFLPVVMLTGQGNESLVVSAMREGAQNYLSKSTITAAAVQRVVRMAIEHCTMAKRMDEQRESLEVFSRALAHDLKEPVRTIRSYIELIGTPETSDAQKSRYFEYVRDSADRMTRLIDTIHFYTSIDAPETSLRMEVCELGAVLDAAKENIAELIRERDAVITGSALPTVHANWMQLLQVVQNLLCNAIHHCPERPTIRMNAVKENGRWVIRVSDNGAGIAAPQRDLVFKPFLRLNAQGGQRLGLGLAICKKIVELHGGTIWCEPGSPSGSIFSFTMPLEAEEGAEGADASADAVTNARAEGRQPVANILLVDDNQADLELIQLVLTYISKMRCNFLVATNAYEALEIMEEEVGKSNVIDLVLLDINMPGMNGLELLEHIRNERSFDHIPVVMCSTSFYDRDISRAKSLGAVDYITKPMEFTKFKGTLDKLSTVQLHRVDEGYVLTRAA